MNTISTVNAVRVEANPAQVSQAVMLHQYYVGCFHTHIRAEKTVITSGGYYRSGKAIQYNYCVIKEITLELYPRVIREDWFKWTGGSGGCYSYVPKPPVREIISGNSSCIGKRINGSNIG